MAEVILILIIMAYFIRQQFCFETVTKLNYFFLPIFSLYQLISHFTFSSFNLIALLIIVAISLGISYFQAKYATIRREKIPQFYYVDKENREKTIYKKVVKVKGGEKYLLGWILIFVIQIIAQIFITKSRVSAEDMIQSLWREALDDILFVFRFTDIDKGNSSSWYAWALYGISSLGYTFFLIKRSPMVRGKLFDNKKEKEYELEEF